MTSQQKISPYYLRITATPNCNLKCIYCNPNGECVGKYMSDKELLESIRAAYQLGIRTVHFTGGEPTIRKNFVSLVKETKKIGITTIDITTNGVIFNRKLNDLRKAGVTGVSISLDALDAKIVKEITGKDILKTVKQSIVRSSKMFDSIVVNMVVMRRNIGEIRKFVDFASQMKGKFIPRFCELQDYGPAYEGNKDDFFKNFVSRDEIIKELKKLGNIIVMPRKEIDKHNGHAEYFVFEEGDLIIGIIAPYSYKWSCAEDSCGRIRVGPSGIVKSCVHSSSYRLNGVSYSDKVKIFKKIIKEKDNKRLTCKYPKRHVPAYKSLRFGQE